MSGAGKKTLALAVLREIFGASVEKVKVENKTWKLEQGAQKKVELYHLQQLSREMTPQTCKKDRYVVQEVINKAQAHQRRG